jgi:hypothetical protein
MFMEIINNKEQIYQINKLLFKTIIKSSKKLHHKDILLTLIIMSKPKA